jgi:hypothetical protein
MNTDTEPEVKHKLCGLKRRSCSKDTPRKHAILIFEINRFTDEECILL